MVGVFLKINWNYSKVVGIQVFQSRKTSKCPSRNIIDVIILQRTKYGKRIIIRVLIALHSCLKFTRGRCFQLQRERQDISFI